MRALKMLMLLMMTLWARAMYADAAPKLTKMEFYLHTKLTTPNQTVVVVAGQNGNLTAIQFGTVSVGDILLTKAQSNTSQQVGRLKTMVLNADSTYFIYPHAHDIMTAVIEMPQYHGTFSINGRDIADGSELAIVGGTGDFRGVKGWANFTHVEVHPPDSITHVIATLLHPPSRLYNF